MDLIKSGRKLTKTIRNMGRLKEIVSTFAKHGFADFLSYGLSSTLPDFILPRSESQKILKKELENYEEKELEYLLGKNLRQCFEELGPSFIKIGQLLSTREDLFGPIFLGQMKLLRDQAAPLTLEQVQFVLEESLKTPLETVFESISPVPLGTASIGVVFRAKLKNQEDVVIKIQRPGIKKIVETDFSILLFFIEQLEKSSEEVRYLGLTRIIQDFFQGIQTELNFNTEGINAKRFGENLSLIDHKNIFVVPKILEEFSSSCVLVMEEIKGIPFSYAEKILEKDPLIDEKMSYGVELFAKTLLTQGLFHADLHGGNFFLQEDGRIGIIDFGLMGYLGPKNRLNFVAIIYALLTKNFELLVYEFLEVAEYEELPDVDDLIRDIKRALLPFLGLSLKQTDQKVVFSLVTEVLRRHKIYVPQEWHIIFRSLIVLEGVAKSLKIDLNIFTLMEKDIFLLMQETVSEKLLLEEGTWALKEGLSLLKKLPRHLNWFLKQASKNNYKIELVHHNLKESALIVRQGFYFLGNMSLVCTFIFSGIFLLDKTTIQSFHDLPFLSLFLWILAITFFFGGLFKKRK